MADDLHNASVGISRHQASWEREQGSIARLVLMGLAHCSLFRRLTIRGNWLMRSFRAARPSADGPGTSTCDGARERRGAVTCFELEEERTLSILRQ